ncbi:MAG: ABC transporter ATP-binding protein [Candidatus Firestonebacteria bacterium]|nr:ABC transporter ATP-binding protein [Candidatus Firestonebacteria bacterium]
MKNYFEFLKFAAVYKIQIFLILISIILYTISSGISIGMIQPIFDYVLIPQNSSQSKLSTSLEKYLKKIPVEYSNMKKWTEEKIKDIDIYSRKDLLKIILIIILLSIFTKALTHVFHSYWSFIVTQKLLRDIRNKLYKHLQILPLDYFRRKQTGSIISHITNDVILLDNFITQGLLNLVLNGLEIILFGTILFYIHFKLAIFSIFVLVFTVLPIRTLSKKLYKLSSKLQEKMAEITGMLNETVSGVKSVKAFCQEKHEQEKFSIINNGITKNMLRSARANAILIPLVELMVTIGMVLVLIYGGKEIIYGKLSSGQFILFLGVFLSLGNPIKKVSQVISYIQQGTAAIDRIFSILLIPSYTSSDNTGLKSFCNIEKDICFKNVNFRYNTETETLENINIQIIKGEVIAFVGASGAGKSTLLDMLPRFLEPESGSIEIDGIDIRNFNIKSLRDKIGIVSQEVILFYDTVRNNIAYGKPEASQEEIENAARRAYAHDFIMELQEGYNTTIGERGSKLSGGQRQRISIARAILKNPPILILDEATSNIDLQSEQVVQEALHNLMDGKTTFIIAHRFSSIKQAKKIILMEHGKIIDSGSHSKLLETSNYYKHLWELQHIGDILPTEII